MYLLYKYNTVMGNSRNGHFVDYKCTYCDVNKKEKYFDKLTWEYEWGSISNTMFYNYSSKDHYLEVANMVASNIGFFNTMLLVMISKSNEIALANQSLINFDVMDINGIMDDLAARAHTILYNNYTTSQILYTDSFLKKVIGLITTTENGLFNITFNHFTVFLKENYKIYTHNVNLLDGCSVTNICVNSNCTFDYNNQYFN